MPQLRLILVALVGALASVQAAGAQTAPGAALEGVDGMAALDALAQECYEARLTPDMQNAEVLDCSSVIVERLLAGAPEGEDRFVVTHKIRFTLLGRATDARVGVEAWTKTEELGSVIEQPITSADYLGRAQRVLGAVVARLRGRTTPPWAGRYESEQAWHLDAHLKSVSHCDSNLASMAADSVAAQLRSLGLYPLYDDTRDLCEQLYTHLFEWGLARGDAEPTVAKYARYRAALPPEQRTCTGQLAPDATCP
jgi:hypothetical protein